VTSNLEGLAQPLGGADGEGAPKRALVIAAHPDDADFGAAGTAHLWSKQGWEFYYLVCTNGSKGSDDPSMTPDDLIRLRREEQREAAKYLGVAGVYFLDNVDGELTAGRQFLGEVVRCVRQVRPYAVFTHEPESIIVRDSFVNHADHRVTGMTAIDAVYPAARDRLNFPEHIAEGLEPHKVREIYIWGSDRTNFEVDITDVIEVKAQALLLHKTQFEEEFVRRALDIWKTPEGKYFEAFRRVQMWA
jgi:LmbE family N-acetylglucosaminyl deacetylase